MSVLKNLTPILQQSLARHGIPGAALAVSADGVLYEAAAGVVNTTTGIPCTPQSLFMFGSVTKTVTATMALRLIEQGKLALDDRVVNLVPEFQPPDQTAAGITVAQLLTHSSGLVGSIFKDTGRNDDALAKQIALLNEKPLYHQPGALLSYCNSGYILLGRIIELITGQCWDKAVRELAAEPLAMHSLVTTPEQALRSSTAVGHVIESPGAGWTPIAQPFAMAGHGPAGSTMAGRVSDLIRLADCYMQGIAIEPATAQAAWSVQMPALAPGALQGWGHGWMIFDWNGQRIVGHDGSTAGTKSFLRISPDKRVAVALLVNAQCGLPVYEDVLGEIFNELVGAWETTVQDMPEVPVQDVMDCVGAFSDSHLRIEIAIDNDQVTAAVMPDATNPIHRPVLMSYRVYPCAHNTLYATGPGAIFYPPAGNLSTNLVRKNQLIETADGEQYLCNGANVYRRIPAD